ncbi:MAG: AbrB/MazE/SpoVT family DNA-binding domain-containing protein [Myxococcota bacterium]
MRREPPDSQSLGKVFWSGNSQAVRLPRDFRLETDVVRIRRVGDALLLEPVKRRRWSKTFLASLGSISDESFEAPPPLPAVDVDLDRERP